MKLDVNKIDCVVPSKLQYLWNVQPLLNQVEPDHTANTWVQLLQLPNDFSHDEALLLCQLSSDEWVAWVPQHGEIVLHTHQFCSI